MEQDTLLQVEGVWVERPGTEVLRGVDLDLRRGEIHALLGLNGAGKTSLAHAIMGTAGFRPNRGRIVLDGRDVTAYPLTKRARLGLTLAWQEPARFEGLVTADYLALGMREPSRERVEEALRAVGLSPALYLGRAVDSALSGGERKRIELAAVYAMAPAVAILDEPDSGIDAISIPDIVALVRRMKSEGISVLLITHRDEMVSLADRASLICAGVIVRTGDPAEVQDYFIRRCRPHAGLLGDQPWGTDAGGAYERVMAERVCDE